MPGFGHAVESTIGAFRRLLVQNDLNRGWRMAGLKFQMFRLYLENQSGVIKHYFYHIDLQSGMFDRFNHPKPLDATFLTTPTLTSSAGFLGQCVGFESGLPHILHFDTIEPQDPDRYIGIVSCNIYDGNNSVPRIGAGFKAANINGVTKYRLAVWFHTDMTGASIAAWTTFIPNTRRVSFYWMGYLK